MLLSSSAALSIASGHLPQDALSLPQTQPALTRPISFLFSPKQTLPFISLFLQRALAFFQPTRLNSTVCTLPCRSSLTRRSIFPSQADPSFLPKFYPQFSDQLLSRPPNWYPPSFFFFFVNSRACAMESNCLGSNPSYDI